MSTEGEPKIDMLVILSGFGALYSLSGLHIKVLWCTLYFVSAQRKVQIKVLEYSDVVLSV